MKKNGSLGRDLGNYFAGRVLILLLGLISFPLMARLLSVQDFGSVSLVLRGVMLFTVLAKCGLQHSAARFFEHEQADAPVERHQSFFSTLTFGPLFTSTAIACACWVILLFLRSRFTDAGLFRCLCVAPFLVIARTLQTVMLTLWRNEGRSRLHTTLETSAKVFTLACLAFMFYTGLRSAVLVVVALVVCESLVVLIQWGMLRHEKRIRATAVSRNLMQESLRFGAPLILYELSSLVLDSGDRILIRVYAGGVALGLYSAAYNIAGYVQDALMTPLNLAITPMYMRLWRQNGPQATQAFLSRGLTWFIVAASAVTGLVFLCSSDVITLLASRRFADAHTLLPVLVPGLMLYASHIFLNVGLILSKRTGLMAAIVSVSAVLNLGLNLLLIPRFGSLGSAWATLLSYAVLIAWLAWLNRRLLPLTLNFRLITSAVASALAATWLTNWIHLQLPVLDLVAKALAFCVLFSLMLITIAKDARSLLNRTRVEHELDARAHASAVALQPQVAQGDQP